MADEEEERVSRQLTELLGEVRNMLLGVQILFAGLLIVPFSTGFEHAVEIQRLAYALAVVAVALASVLMVAPSIYHRLRWHRVEAERMLRTANRMATIGTVFLALALMTVVFLVLTAAYDVLPAAVIVAPLVVLIIWIWFVIPITRR